LRRPGGLTHPTINALAETIIGLIKAEAIHRRGPWRSFEAVEYATLEWVDWFNHRRLLEPIGNVPPAEAEARYYPRPRGSRRASAVARLWSAGVRSCRAAAAGRDRREQHPAVGRVIAVMQAGRIASRNSKAEKPLSPTATRSRLGSQRRAWRAS
jgi:hypothetical protein